MKKNTKVWIAVLFLLVLGTAYYLRTDIGNFFAFGLNNWPTHSANEGCSWIERNFSQITLFEENCAHSSSRATLSENQAGDILQTKETEFGYSFKLQLFSKSPTQEPLEVVKEWYSKLTPEQQNVCEIQNPDKDLEYFPNGQLKSTEGPHPTDHKIRYKIDVKQAVLDEIFAQYDGDPGGSPERDYMCGLQLGTTWGAYPPYFEFDDRTPNKYLLVGTFGVDGPSIDLNSLRF